MMKRLLTAGLLAILTTTLCMAQIKESEILSDELCDKLCAAAREKSKELGIDISFAIAIVMGCRVPTVVMATRWC